MSGEHPILGTIRSGGIVPLISSPDPDRLWRAATAVSGAGLGVIEVALRAPGAVDALESLLERVSSAGLPLQVGVGTVLDVPTAERVVELGARFAFSPVLDAEVGEQCRSGGVAWFPGCATPTEVQQAIDLGCDGVKLFPADTLGGPRFVRSIRSVFPAVPAIPSGGVEPTAEALSEWFEAGADAVGVGSSLFPPDGPATSETAMERRLEAAVEAVARARGSA